MLLRLGGSAQPGITFDPTFVFLPKSLIWLGILMGRMQAHNNNSCRFTTASQSREFSDFPMNLSGSFKQFCCRGTAELTSAGSVQGPESGGIAPSSLFTGYLESQEFFTVYVIFLATYLQFSPDTLMRPGTQFGNYCSTITIVKLPLLLQRLSHRKECAGNILENQGAIKGMFHYLKTATVPANMLCSTEIGIEGGENRKTEMLS